jgi:hypothetical protein
VSRIGADDQPIDIYTAGQSDAIVLTQLLPGFVRFLIQAQGFSQRVLPLTLSAGEERTIEVKLDVGVERGWDVPTVPMPLPDRLDSSESVPPQPKPTKHHWWQIFH